MLQLFRHQFVVIFPRPNEVPKDIAVRYLDLGSGQKRASYSPSLYCCSKSIPAMSFWLQSSAITHKKRSFETRLFRVFLRLIVLGHQGSGSKIRLVIGA